MQKRIVVGGSRYFKDYTLFSAVMDECLSNIKNRYELIIVSGHCAGTDLMAERYAADHGYAVEVYPAEWQKYGKSAGPRRNQQMVEVADYAVAFSSGGRGTQSLIRYAEKKGIPVRVYPVKE